MLEYVQFGVTDVDDVGLVIVESGVGKAPVKEPVVTYTAT
jgi:hypothetical protein